MMRDIQVGIDVGSYSIKVAVVEYDKKTGLPRVIGIGNAPSRGVRQGYVSNKKELAEQIKIALDLASEQSKKKIKRVRVSVGGASIESEVSEGSSIPSRSDGVVTSLDIEKAIKESAKKISLANKKVLFSSPIEFHLDGKKILGRPEGLSGTKLSARTLFITINSKHFDDLMSAIGETGVDIEEALPVGILAGNTFLTEKQKTAGCLVINIGAETVTLSLYDDSALQAVQVLPLGGADITNDIALGFKISLEEAESIKLGSLIKDVSKRKLDEIIEARMIDIMELIDSFLKKHRRSGLLPAGVIIIGGCSHTAGIEDIARNNLSVPAKIPSATISSDSPVRLKDPAWFGAFGATLSENESMISDSGSSFGGIKSLFSSFFKQFEP